MYSGFSFFVLMAVYSAIRFMVSYKKLDDKGAPFLGSR